MDNSTNKKRNRLITLPTNPSEVNQLLPDINCKVCGYDSCSSFADIIPLNNSSLKKCLYIEYEAFWLKPRSDCHDCGYKTCVDFTDNVNTDKVSVYDCPYTYGKDKVASTESPKFVDNSEIIRSKNRMIVLPTNTAEIEKLLPNINCKTCGYDSCLSFAEMIPLNNSSINDCPYIEYEVYWLKPRANCRECGYMTCIDFAEDVNEDKAFVFECPYAYGKNKKSSQKKPKPYTDESASALNIEDLIKVFTKEIDVAKKTKKDNEGSSAGKSKKAKSEKPILKVSIDPNLSIQEKERFFKYQLQKASELIKDEAISEDLELIIKNNEDIFAMANKDPSLGTLLRKFSDAYLPATLQLLKEYLLIEGKVLHEEATDTQKQKIIDAIHKAKVAFIKLNDDLFRQISYDIDAQIKAFDDILKIDGLLKKNEFDFPNKHNEEHDL